MTRAAAERVPGRPRIGTGAAVSRVARDLFRQRRLPWTTAEWVRELMAGVPCSRRTAYRALERPRAEGVISGPQVVSKPRGRHGRGPSGPQESGPDYEPPERSFGTPDHILASPGTPRIMR